MAEYAGAVRTWCHSEPAGEGSRQPRTDVAWSRDPLFLTLTRRLNVALAFLEHVVQLFGELLGKRSHADEVAGEDYGLAPQALGQRDRGFVSHLTHRVCTNTHHHPSRCPLQGGVIRRVARDPQQVVREKEIE